jgi:hypothetical protein
MPPPDQTWAWAHVQVSGDDDLPLLEVVTKSPHRCLARLLCPASPRPAHQVLDAPRTDLRGRTARRVAPRDRRDHAGPCVDRHDARGAARAADLPSVDVHDRVRRRLRDAGAPAQARARCPRRSGPAASTWRNRARGCPHPTAAPLPLGGALRPPGTGTPTAIAPAFTAGLTALLNIPADVRASGGTPVVAPPLYGAWHAKRERLATDAPPWFAALNTGPEPRVAAAAGTQVVQQKQEDLMASAWEQVAGIREANQQLRAAQVARAVGERLYQRHVVAADDTSALALTRDRACPGARGGADREGLVRRQPGAPRARRRGPAPFGAAARAGGAPSGAP